MSDTKKKKPSIAIRVILQIVFASIFACLSITITYFLFVSLESYPILEKYMIQCMAIMSFIALIFVSIGVYLGGKIAGGKGKFLPTVGVSCGIVLLGVVLILIITALPIDVPVSPETKNGETTLESIQNFYFNTKIIIIITLTNVLLFIGQFAPFIVYHFSDKRETAKIENELKDNTDPMEIVKVDV